MPSPLVNTYYKPYFWDFDLNIQWFLFDLLGEGKLLCIVIGERGRGHAIKVSPTVKIAFHNAPPCFIFLDEFVVYTLLFEKFSSTRWKFEKRILLSCMYFRLNWKIRHKKRKHEPNKRMLQIVFPLSIPFYIHFIVSGFSLFETCKSNLF